ncbi:hypothetical protein [Streptomyces sp. SBT349]|uniref:hypothetical protein n=1 Tax=Streptomyces sp. SBT349 TaxID=1580539 RepID=UPI00066C1136|nr:hypothetical protein [Streptomyces sp. SBT349]
MFSGQEIEPGIRRVDVDASSIPRGDALTIGGRACIVLVLGITFVGGEFLSAMALAPAVVIR